MDLLKYQQLNCLLERTVSENPSKVAVFSDKKAITYFELLQASRNCSANLYNEGCQPNDRVVIYLGNQIETVIAFWGVILASGIPVLVNPNTPENKLNYIINDSGALLVINNDTKEQLIINKNSSSFPTSTQNKSDLASILYTSGSTGEAKGVMLSHKNMLAATRSLNAYLQYQEHDKVLCVSPLSFDYGLYQMIMTVSVGATLYLIDSMLLPGKVLRLIAKEGITIVPGVPTLFTLLHQYQALFKQDLTSVRKVTNTGAALSRNHIKIIQDLFYKAELFSMYGLTECKRCTYLPPNEINIKPDSVGIAIPYTKIWIADEFDQPVMPGEVGQLVVEGDTVMQGYWNKPEATKRKLKDGRLFTGDYGYLDQDGYFYFKGRMDQSIKIRGQKVSASEIESIIGSFPEVMEVAVIARNSPVTIESEIHAYVSIKGKDQGSKLIEFCKKRLEAFKVPSHFHFLESLPKTDNGKIDKIKLSRPSSLVELVLNTIHKTPEATALWVDEHSYSYEKIFNFASLLASVIKNEPGETCMLYCTRSLVGYYSILSCLLAGKAYVPMNPRLTEERNRLVAEDSLAKVVVIDNYSLEKAEMLFSKWEAELTLIFPDLDEPPEWASSSIHKVVCKKSLKKKGQINVFPTPEAPACLLFTSGSTGRPKGVMLTHKNLLSYWHSAMQVYNPNKDDRFAQITELTFDLSMHDIFLAWGNGASLYVLPEKLYGSLKFFLGLTHFIQRHKLTFWMSVPSSAAIMKQMKLLKSDLFTSLRCTVFCGEPLAESLANVWSRTAPNSALFNLYGPTEATIGFTVHQWLPSQSSGSIVSIGNPLPTQEICLVNEEDNIVKDGEVGELCLGGDQVVTGYWQNVQLTKSRFLNKKFDGKKSKHWYRTGDLAKVSEGRLSFIGRLDDQLQIRGCRVEKLEIENELKKISGTDLVAVVPWPYSEDGILLGVVAFISGSKLGEQELTKRAKQSFPDYMVPTKFYFLDYLPQGGTGKIDYQKLKASLSEGEERVHA